MKEERRLKICENRELRRIFGPKRDEVRDEWREPYNEEFNDLYFSPNIVRVIKSRRKRWAGFVSCMGRGGTCTGFVGNLKERVRLGDRGVDWRKILRKMFRKWEVGYGLDRAGSI